MWKLRNFSNTVLHVLFIQSVLSVDIISKSIKFKEFLNKLTLFATLLTTAFTVYL